VHWHANRAGYDEVAFRAYGRGVLVFVLLSSKVIAAVAAASGLLLLLAHPHQRRVTASGFRSAPTDYIQW
jgi:hypothetical protein